MTMKYESSLECPHCGHNGKDFEVLKEWAHGLHLVNKLHCPGCQEEFRYYWGERKDGSKFSYTIPKLIGKQK